MGSQHDTDKTVDESFAERLAWDIKGTIAVIPLFIAVLGIAWLLSATFTQVIVGSFFAAVMYRAALWAWTAVRKK